MKINILNKALFVVDYTQEEIRKIESEGEFDEYIKGLIKNINENETIIKKTIATFIKLVLLK